MLNRLSRGVIVMAKSVNQKNSGKFQELEAAHAKTLAKDLERQETIVKTQVAQKLAERKTGKDGKSSR